MLSALLIDYNYVFFDGCRPPCNAAFSVFCDGCRPQSVITFHRKRIAKAVELASFLIVLKEDN